MTINILTVCTANQVRSVMAAAFVERVFASRSVPCLAASAGVLAETYGEGAPATAATVSVMREEGVDVRDHESRAVTEELLSMADLVVVMSRSHLEAIAREWPSMAGRTFVLKHLSELLEAVPRYAGLPFSQRVNDLAVRRGDPMAVMYRGTQIDIDDPVGRDRAAYLFARNEIRHHVEFVLDRLLEALPVPEPVTPLIHLPSLRTADPEMADLVDAELTRLTTCVQLIPSENFPSLAVMEAQGSVFTVKYAEGYAGKRYYGGYQVIDEMEPLVIERAKALFGAEHANVQPHAGAIANMVVYFALLNPGDRVLAMQLDHGGHLTHGSPVNFSGQLYDFVAYGVDPATEYIDMEDVAKKARDTRPRMIVAGATAYPRIPDFDAFRAIADEVGALLMVDMAHFSGLVAGGAHPNPVPFADIVTTTTHKSLRGPRGAMILCKAQYADAIDKMVIPGIQGGPFMHAIAAKGVALLEAMQPSFADYAEQIVANARAFSAALEREGLRIVSGGTDTHLILADVRPFGIKGKPAQLALDEAGITCNRNTIPNDTEKPFIGSGLRFGTPAVTSQGMREAQVEEIAHHIGRVLRHMKDPDFASLAAAVRHDVASLCANFPPYPELTSA